MADIPKIFDQPNAGFVLLPAGQKFPPIEKGWQEKPHTFAEAAAHAAKGGNVGLLAGNCYIGLDQDDPDAFVCVSLPITTTWETRARRMGMWFKLDGSVAGALASIGKKPDLAQIKLYKDGQAVGEVKLARSYQVIPPSWKSVDGQRVDYKMLSEVPPARINLAWLLHELMKAGITFSSKTDGNRKYAEAALAGELEKVRAAPKGDRNNQLNKSAFALGQLVGAGLLQESEVIQALVSVAEDDEPHKILTTIRSGIEAGMKSPREILPGQPVKDQATVDGDVGRVGDYRFAEILAASFDGNTRWATHRGAWMVYKKGCWTETTEQEVIKMASDVLHDHFVSELARAKTKNEIKEMSIELIKANTTNAVRNALTFVQGWPGIVTRPEEWDRHPWLLNVRNGTLDLKTGEFHPHNPADLLTAMVKADFDPAATCPKWEAHIQGVAPEPNIRRQVQRDLGRALVGATLEESLPIWYGSGANGRSTTVRVLMTILASYTRRAAPNLLIQSKYERHPAEVADLAGSRLVFSIEVEEGKKLAEVLVKEMTGGDKKKARFMHQDFFEFEQTFDIFLIVNHKPVITGTDEGIWRRVKLVPWTHTIPREARRPQEDVVKELMQERSGILNWLLAGLKDWQADHLWIAPEVQAATEVYRSEMDILKPFVDEYCEIKPHFRVTVADLYSTYLGYCVLTSESPLNKRDFSQKIKERGFSVGRGTGGKKTCYGIGLKPTKSQAGGAKVTESDRVSNNSLARVFL